MKFLISSISLLVTVFSFSQANEIAKLLNAQFKREQSMYKKDDVSKPSLVQPYTIKDDSLIVEFKLFNEDEKEEYYERRSVKLSAIKILMKDMNIIFSTKQDLVQITSYKLTSKGAKTDVQKRESHLFFTELRKDYGGDKFLQEQLVEAFAKIGQEIFSEDWYD